MNKEVYDNLDTARILLLDMQISHIGSGHSEELGAIVTAVDDALDELDRLGKMIKELEKHLRPRSMRNEIYLEHHESAEELGIKHSGYGLGGWF